MRLFAILLWLGFCIWAMVWGKAMGAEMCAPDTNPTVCVIIEMRDNALDEAAKAEGGRRVALAQLDREQAYWKAYLQGLDEQAAKAKTEREQLAAWWDAYVTGAEADRRESEALLLQTSGHVQNVCAWKGTMSEPVAQLCSWWKGSGR